MLEYVGAIATDIECIDHKREDEHTEESSVELRFVIRRAVEEEICHKWRFEPYQAHSCQP